MIVVDIETTGTNPQKHSIVSIGAIDLEAPSERFYIECHFWDGAHIDPSALIVNDADEASVRDANKPEEGEAVRRFFEWLDERGNVLLAGQNPLFDIGFLQAAAARHHIDFQLAHRSIDLHTVAFFHMIKNRIEPPFRNKKSDINSDYIMAYAGIPTEPKPHNALNGAIWEAEAFSRLLYDKNLLEQFYEFLIPWR